MLLPHKPKLDHGPPERWRHGDRFEVEEGEDAGVFRRRVLTQTPLDRYHQRDEITERQYVAGRRLYGLWRASGSETRVTASYAPPVEHAGEISQRQANIRADFTRVMRDGVGLIHSAILVHVCLCGESAKDWALMRGMARKRGIDTLRRALTALADYWRL